jgi:hypothetical protein
MPRKAKDKEELIEEKDIKKERTKKIRKNNISKKVGSPKDSSPTLGEKNAKVITSKLNVSPKTSTPTSKKEINEKKSTSRRGRKSTKENTDKKSTTTKKRNEFLSEYYDLPFSYNKTVVKLLAQTPETLFVYWEISDDDRKMYKEKFGDNFFETSTPILKVHNITMNYYFEVEINDFANCWYLHVNDSKCEYEIELDRKKYIPNKEPEYVYISKSNELEAPNDHVLLEKLPDFVTFKNVKTNNTKNVKVPKNINKIFGTREIYNMFYKDNEFINNPSSKF